MKKYFGEIVGTFILCFFGLGSLHAAIACNMYSGIMQIAMVWGFGVALAIYTCGAISGAHLNPAMTFAFWLCADFPRRQVLPYIISQFIGAFAAAATLYFIFEPAILSFEAANSIVRDQASGVYTAMMYANYYPNPAVAKSLGWNLESFTMFHAILAEGLGTALLAFFVFSLTDKDNKGSPKQILAPLFIGVGVAILIAVLAPISQAGFNPARDLGPRLFAYLNGWGSTAMPSLREGFIIVYTIAPIVGAILGAKIYKKIKVKK